MSSNQLLNEQPNFVREKIIEILLKFDLLVAVNRFIGHVMIVNERAWLY